PPGYTSTVGIELYGKVDVEIRNGSLDNCHTGYMMANTLPDSKMNFTNIVLQNSNTSIGDSFSSSGEAIFRNCDMDSIWRTTDLNGSLNPLRVDFINTTWNRSAPMGLHEDVYLNISWFMDVRITDGNGEPIDSRFSHRISGSGPFVHLDSSTGVFEKILFRDRSLHGEEPQVTTTWDFQFRSNDEPSMFETISNHNVNDYSEMNVEINFKPTNDLPMTLDLVEDQWFELNLYDHFADREDEELEFELEMSANLNVVQPGGSTSGDIRIKNKQPDWYGTGWVKITGTDSGGKTTMANSTVEVHPVNDAPMFTEALPMLTIKEDSWTYFNFTGKVVDVEGTDVTLSFSEDPDYTVEYNETLMNLTIWPAENFFGMLEVEINLSDGDAWTHDMLMINVTSVNDLPEIAVMMDNITAEIVEYALNETTNISVHEMVLDEDTSIDLWIDATDVDSENLSYSFDEEDLMHGSIEVEVNQIEVIVNETSNETEMQNIIVPMNFTYTPDANDDNGDLVKFLVSDGEGQTETWVWFHVMPVNDPIEFTAPAEWNVTVDIGTLFT
ncbi:MAG: hypothetical protein U9R75_11900, partial [Candidatus Thermoplasmatota archaeon]|nr:hypothetical protein [Candidatus Thermoplasmatota archaeon]